MKLITQKPILVIAGAWNISIFKPEWIKEFIFTEDFKVEIPINAPLASPRYIYDDIQLNIEGGRFLLSMVGTDDSAFEKIEDICYEVVNYLPHTPAMGFGINFGFVEENPGDLKSLFQLNDSDELLKENYEMKTTVIKRIFQHDTCVLNFEISTEGTKFVFLLNYHFNISKITEVKEQLTKGDIRNFFDQSVSLIKNVYGYDLE